MLKQIVKTISRFNMLPPGTRLGVACSGGPDSTALLFSLQELSAQLGCTLAVCHFNHMLRGEESEEDERFVRDLARRLGLPCHVERGNARASARRHGGNLENAARGMRYAFFDSLVAARQIDRIAVGHTADDQAETVVHRLLRGSGSRGFAGIHPVMRNRVVRPLLEVRRSEVLEWLESRREPWRTDASNADPSYTRNRIRHELLPLLETFNPRVIEALGDTASIARDEEAFWRQYLPPILAVMAKVDETGVTLDIGGLRGQPIAVARRIVRWAVATAQSASETEIAVAPSRLREDCFRDATAKPLSALDFQHVESVLQLAWEGRSGSRLLLPSRMVAAKEFSRLLIARAATPAANPGFLYRLPVPGSVEVPETGSSFCCEIVNVTPAEAEYNEIGSVLLHEKVGGFPLTLRNWRAGDRYQPRGRQKRKKLKELFVDKRIALSERQAWPVLLAGARIVWARGFEPENGCCPEVGDERALLLRERKL